MIASHTLPDDFGPFDGDACIRFYSNDRASSHNKVTFTRNLCCFVLQGSKQVHTAVTGVTAQKGELLLLGGGATLMSESLAPDGHYEAVLVFFGNDTLARCCAAHGILPDKGNAAPLLSLRRDAFLEHYVQSLQLVREDTALHRYKVEELLAYLATRHQATFSALAAHSLGDAKTVRLRQVVEAHASENLSVEALAFLCHMSASTFKRHFAAAFGMPPRRYLSAVKMEQARAALAQGRRPSEIYAEMGFENLSSFSAAFRKHFGLRPSAVGSQNEPNASLSGLVG